MDFLGSRHRRRNQLGLVGLIIDLLKTLDEFVLFDILHTTPSSMKSSTVSLLAGSGGARLLHWILNAFAREQGTPSRISAVVR